MNKIISWVLAFTLIGGFTMARGTPDGGQNLSSSPVSQVFDPGENTSRMLMGGGSNSRAGRWLWATGFESGSAEVDLVGVPTPPTISAQYAYMGGQSVQFRPGPGPGTISQIIKTVFTPIVPNVQSLYGAECMLALRVIGNKRSDFEWIITVPRGDGVNRTLFWITLQVLTNSTGNLYVYNGATGLFDLFANVDPHILESVGLYHYSKLVVNAFTGKYSTFTFDHVTYNISNLQGFNQASTRTFFQTTLSHRNQDIADPIFHVDNFILTADEP